MSKTSKLQYTVVQMLKNPDATSLASWTGSGESYALNSSASNVRIGSTSLKLAVVNTPGSKFEQTVTVDKGKTYTFSAYVKPDADAISFNSACVSISYKNGSGQDRVASSQKLIPSEDGWYRLETTVTIPSDSTSTQVTAGLQMVDAGVAYFDCMQFEQGDCASRYNLIENNDFSDGTTGYTFTGTDVFDNVVNLDSESSAVPTAIISSGYCTTSAGTFS